MSNVRDTIHVRIDYFTGQDDDGTPYYVASCAEIGAVTDGPTMDELFKNIREAISLALEGEDTISTYNLIDNPRIVITMEFLDYAQIA